MCSAPVLASKAAGKLAFECRIFVFARSSSHLLHSSSLPKRVADPLESDVPGLLRGCSPSANRPYFIGASDKERDKAQRKDRMIERSSEVLPERRIRAWIISRKKHGKHQQEPT